MSLFKLKAHKAVKKDLKKIPSQAAREIVNKVLPIYHQQKIVFVVAIGPREKFYERLVRRIG